jgi:hypothetical protein
MKTLLGAGAVLLGLGVTAPPESVAATSNFAAEQAFVNATGVTQQAAVAVALKAVGGGKVIQAVFEKQDHIPHWSIDIVLAPNEHEVWVSAAGKVIRVITQPM